MLGFFLCVHIHSVFTEVTRTIIAEILPRLEAYLNPVKHLFWSLFAKTVDGYNSLTTFSRTLRHRCLTGL